MTWGEFKRLVEAEGVKDDTEIDYIDVSIIYRDELNVSVGDDGKTFSVTS